MTSVAIGDLVTVRGGGTPRKSVPGYYGGGIPWVTPKDMKRMLIDSSEITLTTDGVENSPAKMVPSGSVLVVVRSGVLKHTLPVALTCAPVTLNQDMKALIPHHELEGAYLARLLKARQPEILGWVRATTADNFPIQKLLDLQIDLPPLSEQRRITAILDHADALRARRRRVLAHLDILTQSTFYHMFGNPMANVAGLPVQVLREWVDPERPITYGILKPGPHVPDGVPYVRVADMQDRGIALPGVRRTTEVIAAEYRRSILRSGDLLMSISGHVGRFAFVPESLDGANITQDSARISLRDRDAAVYVRAAIETPSAQHWMARRTKGAAVKGINLGDLRELPLPLPSHGEIRRFARAIRKIEHQREAAQRMATGTGDLVASLQSRAFRGDL